MAAIKPSTTLADVARLLADPQLHQQWPQVAAHIASLLGAKHCAIVLAGSCHDGGGVVRAYGGAGAVRPHKVASAMLVAADDGGAPGLRHDAAARAMFVPVCVDGMVLGVLHLRASTPFTSTHIDTSQVVALLIGKALHLGRLQTILNSRFAQLALLRHGPSAAIALRHSRDTATLMAKAFYKEMADAGFPAPDIIGAASDIIAELTHTLKQNSARGTYSGGASPLQ
jgi:L-methionine (R)-S-oxide reductase